MQFIWCLYAQMSYKMEMNALMNNLINALTNKVMKVKE